MAIFNKPTPVENLRAAQYAQTLRQRRMVQRCPKTPGNEVSPEKDNFAYRTDFMGIFTSSEVSKSGYLSSLDLMAVDAVRCKPFSKSKFPLTGKDTGNFRILISSVIRSPRGLPSVYGQIRSTRFSAGKKEQGIFSTGTENFRPSNKETVRPLHDSKPAYED